MLITAYGTRTGRGAYAGEAFSIDGLWRWRTPRFHQFLTRIVIDLAGPADGIGVRAVATDPDVIVLTHDDDDHIGGAARALATLPPRRGRQVWLPADWWYVLSAWGAALETHPGPVGTPATVSPAQISALVGQYGSAERPADSRRDRVQQDSPRLPGLVRSRRPQPFDPRQVNGLIDWLESLDGDPPGHLVGEVAKAVSEHRRFVGREEDAGPFAGTPRSIARRVIQRARHIAEIVRRAATTSDVRWFTVDTWPDPEPPWLTEGLPGVVTLVNAHEVAVPRLTVTAPAETLLQASFLTVQNNRALVTFVWPDTSATDGLLAWSDSAGHGCDPTSIRGGRTPWLYTGVMTAPHHASDVSDHQSIWDGRRAASNRIGVLLCNNHHTSTAEYTALPPRLRAATQLDGSRYPASPQDAHALSRGARWFLSGH